METTETKKKLDMPSKILKVKIVKNEYEIKLPNNGQRIDIESMKINMTRGAHKDLLFGGSSAREAYMLTEAIAAFTVLIPSLEKDLITRLFDLDIMQSQSLVKAYEKYYEWDQSWREFVNQEIDEDEE